LVKQLQDFSASTRSNEETGTMHRIAQQLDEESIRSVAFYLAREQPRREE
jgi:cytochrome c553